MRANRQGFTLLEIAVVLTIIALVVAGVVGGRELIRTAQTQSLVDDAVGYVHATQQFRDKYGEWPGDAARATKIWGAADAGDGIDWDCYQVNSTSLVNKQATCNGNGDGKIGFPDLATSAQQCFWNGERYRFWQHLANAGFVRGQYTGICAANTSGGPTTALAAVFGKNVPATKVNRTVFEATYQGPQTDHPGEFFHDINANALTFYGSRFYAVEAQAMDSKFDDGEPTSGAIQTFKKTGSWSPNCATSDAMGAKYDIAANVSTCLPMFIFKDFRPASRL